VLRRISDKLVLLLEQAQVPLDTERSVEMTSHAATKRPDYIKITIKAA